jgi:hypothetical protein
MSIDINDKEAFRLLSCDNDGTMIGSDQVCLMEPTPIERIPAVLALLEKGDDYVRWRSAAVLCAWGQKVGFDYLMALAVNGAPESLAVPHRIHGEDNFYDQLAQDIHFYGLETDNEDEIKKGLQVLLGRYSNNFFEGYLKMALLRRAAPDLLEATCQALEAAWAAGHQYQASQLLPVIYKTDEGLGKTYLARFEKLPPQTPDPRHNVIEALGYSKDLATLPKLQQYLQNADSGVRSTAKDAVEVFKKMHQLA